MKKTKYFILFSIILLLLSIMISCKDTAAHNHSFATELSFNETHHWYACLYSDCHEMSFMSEHSYTLAQSNGPSEHTLFCVCGLSISEPHGWNNGEITIAPTTESKGEKIYTCEKCSAIYKEEVPVLQEEIQIPSTDSDSNTNLDTHSHTFGNQYFSNHTNHWKMCCAENCNEISESAEHIFDNGVETKAATKEEDGILTFTCTVCSYTKTQAIKYNPSYTVDESQWQAAQVFENCTVEVVYDTENLKETVVYEIAGEKVTEKRGTLMLYRQKHNGVWYLSIDAVTAVQNEFSPTLSHIAQRYDISEYSDYIFDKSSNAYINEGISALFFEDSVLTKCILYYSSGTITITLTNYSQTNMESFPVLTFKN